MTTGAGDGLRHAREPIFVPGSTLLGENVVSPRFELYRLVAQCAHARVEMPKAVVVTPQTGAKPARHRTQIPKRGSPGRHRGTLRRHRAVETVQRAREPRFRRARLNGGVL